MLSYSFNTRQVKSKLNLGWISTKKRLRKVIKDTTILIYSEAYKNSPIDTGKMKASIYYKINKKDAEVGVNVEYAKYVEYGGGTPRKAGTIPFFTPAVEKGLKHLKRELGK